GCSTPRSPRPGWTPTRTRDAARSPPGVRRLLRADALELLAHGLGPAPHLHDLDAAAARLAHPQLALQAGVVEQLQRAVDGRGGRRVAEAVRDEDPPVPVVLGVRLGVDRAE